MNFDQSITFAIARTMQDLAEFAFVNMAKTAIARCYIDHLKSSIKHNTIATLRITTIYRCLLFLDNIIQKADEEISHYDDDQYSSSSHKKCDWYQPCAQSSRFLQDTGKKSHPPAWKIISSCGQNRRDRGKTSHNSKRLAKAQSSYK